jgi:hypothetical protein
MGATAKGLLKQISSFEFVLYLECLYALFKETNHLSECLQLETIDIVNANALAQATITNLKSLASSQCFDKTYDAALKIAIENGILMSQDTSLATRSAKRYCNLFVVMSEC